MQNKYREIDTKLLTILPLSIFPTEAVNIMWEIHKGTCGNHTRGQSLAFKALKQGYYWPTMKTYYMEYAWRCEKCQWLSLVSKAHPK